MCYGSIREWSWTLWQTALPSISMHGIPTSSRHPKEKDYDLCIMNSGDCFFNLKPSLLISCGRICLEYWLHAYNSHRLPPMLKTDFRELYHDSANHFVEAYQSIFPVPIWLIEHNFCQLHLEFVSLKIETLFSNATISLWRVGSASRRKTKWYILILCFGSLHSG